MQLNGNQTKRLSAALRDAFKYSSLKRMLFESLDLDLEDITLGDDMQEVVFELLQASNRGSWAEKLVFAALAEEPTNPKLLDFAQAEGLLVGPPTKGALESVVRATGSLLDPAIWREGMAVAEARVGQITVRLNGAIEYGTGFLVAADLVMTNYHVIEPVLNGAATPKDVTFTLDFKKSADGKMIQTGTPFAAASDRVEEFILDHSPYADADLAPGPAEAPRAADELDYALLKFAGAAGQTPRGGLGSSEAPDRGCFELPADPPKFLPGGPLYILQHPSEQPLKLAHDHAIVSVNDNRTRLRYGTNTLPGSSGSPCFDANWNLVALHHSGDPRWQPGNRGDYNQGVPIDAVANLLETRGKKELLGC